MPSLRARHGSTLAHLLCRAMRLCDPARVRPAPGVYPREAPRPTSSTAERTVWKALHDRLPREWYAWHSLRLRDRHASFGEGDFVLAHPDRGILLLEVRGGAIAQRDGSWFQNGHRLAKPPLDEASPEPDGLDLVAGVIAEEGGRALHATAERLLDPERHD